MEFSSYILLYHNETVPNKQTNKQKSALDKD